MTKEFWMPVIALLAGTPICLFLGMASSGMGHGDYFLAKLLFPFTMILAGLSGSITSPLILLAVAQYPLYGAIFGFANERGKLPLATGIVVTIHALMAAVCLVTASENFS